MLLVDDEPLILDGISSVIEWEALGTTLIGTASNGLEALTIVEEQSPDIIITDIRMPGMDGLRLVETVRSRDADIDFVMLTGFSEFEYAKTAMQFGVKHYLLKPCSEEKLEEALRDIVRSKRGKDENESFVQAMQYSLERVLPHAKEQFLKELVMNKTYGMQEWHFFCQLFGLQFRTLRVRLLLLDIESGHEYEHLFAAQNIAQDIFANPMLSTTVGGRVLLLMEDQLAEEMLFQRVHALRETFKRYYRYDVMAALSEPGELGQVRTLYLRMLNCLSHRFYLGQGGLIMERDIALPDDPSTEDFVFDAERLLLPIKAGHWQDSELELRSLFEQLAAPKFTIAQTKSYMVQIFMEIIRLCNPAEMKAYLDQLPHQIEHSTLQAFQQLVLSIAKSIAQERFEQTCRKQSQLVQRIQHIVQQKYRDDTLTLQTVANEIYMNPDYVGKMFKLETGEKFTNYVMNYRMQKAIELLDRGDNVTVASLAEQVGFGCNASYFSKMFKKYTDYTLTEYRKIPQP
ncbi:response regulator [Paenibacillus phyllosphaerae]|uniref:response regulator n=1 Tax=Paenibacillus phyllosphaerae TaxID=274593 RepID=UPI0031B5D358